MLPQKSSHSGVQWKTSKSTEDKPSWSQQHSLEITFISILSIGFIIEYLFGYGIITLCILSLFTLIYSSSARRHSGNIPEFSLYYPIVGNLPWMVINFSLLFYQTWQEFLKQSKKNDGKPVPLMCLQTPGRSQVFVTDPLLVDIIFRKQFADAIKDEISYQSIKPILGNGIFAANGKIWKKHRAVASRMFTTRSLRDYMFENFITTGDKMVLKCEELMNTQGKNGIDIYDMFLRLTFEAFTNSAFGVDINAVNSAPNVVPFAKAFDESLELTGKRYAMPAWIWKTMRWMDIGMEKRLRIHINLMEAFIKDVIAKRREYFKDLKNDELSGGDYQKQLRQKYDLLSLFIKDNPNISDKELRDITMNFIIAGRDTTAQTLGWMMYELTRTDKNGNRVNQGVEERIRKEIETVLKKNGETGIGDSLSYQSMSELKYLEATLLETLRLNPSVPHLVRAALTDFNFGEITGDYKNYNYTIRKGDEILIATWSMGKLPWVWNSPLKFNPERFYDIKNNKIIEYDGSKYPAFNVIPRMCLGKNLALLEAKIAVVKLFVKFNKITMVPGQKIESLVAATNHIKSGLKLVLE